MYLIRLPRMGQTMESGTILTWHFAEGDEFHEGDNLYEVETDKSVTEVEAKQGGVLARIVIPTEENVPVGTTLAVAAAPDEAYTPEQIDDFLDDGSTTAPAPKPDAASKPGETGLAATPPAGQESADHPATEAATEPAPPSGGPVRAVPKARSLAKKLGIDLRTVRGTGEGGTIRVQDVEAAAGVGAAPASGSPAGGAAADGTDTPGPDGDVRVAERIPLRGVAKAMAESVTRSWRQVPQFVQQVSLDATALKARLARLRYEGTEVTYTDLLIAAVAAAAREVPEVNATFADTEIIRYADVNVSVAVAADRGLLVPVVRHADQLSLADLAAATRALAEQARAGRLSPEDLSGGTITVSNLGAYGVETGFPLVNAPQSAIVFAGALQDRVVAVDGQVAVRPVLNLAIGYDHRVLDGMTAARFTSALKSRLEAGG